MPKQGEVKKIMEGFLTDIEVAKYLCLKPRTIRMWRRQGKGPNYFRLGRSIRYTIDELQRWAELHKIEAGKKAKAKTKSISNRGPDEKTRPENRANE